MEGNVLYSEVMRVCVCVCVCDGVREVCKCVTEVCKCESVCGIYS